MIRLGNVQFGENEDGNSTIPDEGVTEFIAYLMEVDKDTVTKVLTSRVVETGGIGRRGSSRLLSFESTASSALARELVLTSLPRLITRIDLRCASQRFSSWSRKRCFGQGDL